MKKPDVAEVRQAARGQWLRILESVCRLDSRALNPKIHGPCPMCGGTDRFRALDDVADSGALFCNQCHNGDTLPKSGDGLSSVQWLLRVDFPEALRLVAAEVDKSPWTSAATTHVPAGTGGKKIHATANAAADALAWGMTKDGILTEQRKPDAGWRYRHADGSDAGAVFRWDQDDGRKEIRQVSAADGGWVCGAMPEPRPLYRLPQLLAADTAETVWIVEGEKSADVGPQLGLCTVTSAGGSNAAEKTDWKPVRGRRVVIVPDNDEPGESYAAEVARLCSAAGASSVGLLRLPTIWPQCPVAGDLADFSEAFDSRTAEELRAMLERAAVEPVEAADNSRKGTLRPPVTEPRLMTVKASEVEPKDLDWLWAHRFLVGHINIIGGDPGLGKSMILIDVAARASKGMNWPDGSECKRCSVLYSTTEDGIEDTVVPRLIAAGADLERVHIVEGVKCHNDSEQPLLLNEHLRLLDDNLTENPDIRILIVDTLQSHIGSAVTTNNNSSVRGVMTPLKRLAEKHHVAVLCIEHLTKSKTTAGENATYRVQGSIAFAGAARSVWIVAKDQEDTSGKRRFLQAAKTNLAPDNSGLGLAYEIFGQTGKPVVRWLETDVSTPIDQLLRIPDGSTGDQSKGSELGRCCDWLADTLVEPMASKDIENGAKSEMIAPRTLKRAKEQLGIRAEKRGAVWYWIPPADMEKARTQRLIAAAES